ncbi:ATP-binding protein [Brevundimonas lenta]|uniref:histidine kinase n=1 Tax=Brevundimonas lenta TaxID=424796 RepID=A0A7W6JFQ7_9CAUL|nr:ATP-binding protein [Brevundimonas lenta]MBB4084292.1 signal transduction histidine kinase/CheY-like chemotaxis protein [Brevundimonas lenta]
MGWLSTVRARGVPLVAMICLAILLVAGLLISISNERAMKEELAREAGAQADLLASAVSGALAFDDRQAAQDYVNAVQVNPSVLAAAIYDENNRLVAGYARPGEVIRPVVEPRGTTTLFQDGKLYVDRPVVEGGQRLGTARLRLMDTPASQRLSRYAGMMLVLALAALLIAVLTLTQSALRVANRALTARAAELASANDRLQEQMVERERAEEALRQSQKMEAIGRLTGGVAHDFNNLLMVVSSAIDLLQRSADPARRQALMDGMRQAVDRGSGLTRQLLAFSRQTPLRTAVIDVGDQVEGMRILLERSLREDIAVDIEVRRPLRPIEVDVGELELAILNLAVNARDAMPEGGRLVITVEMQGEGPTEAVRISVADTGSGIPEALLPRVFEPFFTTKEVGKGTGLGLSQVYGFARSSGGEVHVGSTHGEGATFILSLPVTDKTVSGAPVRATYSQPAGEGRVLLVEDDESVAEGVGHMLSELGYTHVRASTGEEALRVFHADPAFDLVLSDMVMPGTMNGLALATELRAIAPDLPVILSTGFSDAAATASRAGFTLLSKPYGLSDLAATLAAALPGDDHRNVTEPPGSPGGPQA